MKAIRPITRSQQKADFDKDREIIKDLMFKIRLFSGVAQSIINNAIYDVGRNHKILVKQELKLALKAVRQQLQRISEREHEITKSEEIDWYFDDRSDDLYDQVKNESFITYNIAHKFFSDHGTENPSLPATIVAAVFNHSLVMDCMAKTIEAAPITERFKPIIKEHVLIEHEILYRLATKSAEHAIKRTKFKVKPEEIFVDDGFNLGAKYKVPLELALEQLGLKIVDLKTWRILADNEHEQLGNKASIRKKPIPIKQCKSSKTSKTSSATSAKKESNAK